MNVYDGFRRFVGRRCQTEESQGRPRQELAARTIRQAYSALGCQRPRLGTMVTKATKSFVFFASS
jgi:hypothetical protein